MIALAPGLFSTTTLTFKLLGHALGDQPGDDVDIAAGGERHDDPDRPILQSSRLRERIE